MEFKALWDFLKILPVGHFHQSDNFCFRSMTDIISASEEIAYLRKEIERHNHLYYVDAKPELSDYDFDKLLEKLIALEHQFPDLVSPDSPSQRVGGTITRVFPTVQHREPMLSLSNSM